MENMGRQVRIGDLVMLKPQYHQYEQVLKKYQRIGIVLSWYDSPKNLVEVMWWLNGVHMGKNPIVTNRLEVINECECGQSC